MAKRHPDPPREGCSLEVHWLRCPDAWRSLVGPDDRIDHFLVREDRCWLDGEESGEELVVFAHQ
eukprot:11826315-Alexandrium_andersonii.AAC.1